MTRPSVGVYGQCTTYVSKKLGICKGTHFSPREMFRGSLFAGARDTISQGAPFMLSGAAQQTMVDPAYRAISGADGDGDEGLGHGLRRAVAVFGTSVCATVLSQFPHNAQIRLQADSTVNYGNVVQTLYREHGTRILWIGSHARIALLLVVNALNELILKRAWEQQD